MSIGGEKSSGVTVTKPAQWADRIIPPTTILRFNLGAMRDDERSGWVNLRKYDRVLKGRESGRFSIMPGRLPDLHKRFSEITLGFLAKHGIRAVGFWTNELGGASDQLIYLGMHLTKVTPTYSVLGYGDIPQGLG
jgi:hypothetical protein